ncbi:MAG: ParA family protein [Oscillospiraceae bacterium]
MRVISIINLKGGVGKTISAVSIAFILAAQYQKRVLLIDNDKQGNASKMLGCHSYDRPSIADVITKQCGAGAVIRPTQYAGLDIMPANMTLEIAVKDVLMDTTAPQHTRLLAALAPWDSKYDFAVIDNAPSVDMATINALFATDDVLIPVKIDNWAFEGLEVLTEQIENIKAAGNKNIVLQGCFATVVQRNNLNRQGCGWLLTQSGYPAFATQIRSTVTVGNSTFACVPLPAFSPRCTASKDYAALVEEYLQKINVSETDTEMDG